MLYAGGGVVHAGAAAELTALARVAGLPVTTTLMALGAFPASDPQWLGMLGMHGTRAANWAMDEADLIVAVGARFDDRVTGALDEFAPHAKVVHIDIDPTEIGKNVAAHIPIVGDARLALEALTRRLRALGPDPGGWPSGGRGSAAGAPRTRRARPRPRRLRGPRGRAGRARGAARRRDRHDRRRPAPDVGGRPAALRAPRRWLTSGGLGTMGFGLPAALGAQAARRTPRSCACPARARC